MEQVAETEADSSSVDEQLPLTIFFDRLDLTNGWHWSMPWPDPYTLVLLASIPGGLVFQKVTKHCSVRTKYLISIVLGILIELYLFPQWELLAMPLQALLVYGLLCVIRPKWKGVGVFLFSMLFQVAFTLMVFYRHYYLKLPDCYVVAPLMSQTQRLTYLAFNLYDGWKHSKGQQLTDLQDKYKLLKMPSKLQLLGYLYNFHQSVFGPAIPMVEYVEFMECPKYQAALQSPATSAALLKEVLKRLFQGLPCFLVSYFIDLNIPLWAFCTLEFRSLSFVWKLICLWPAMFGGRCYFYYMWFFCESANLAAGLGYSGKDAAGKPQWDVGRCVNIIGVEFAGSLRDLKNNWNICTQTWLRMTVFERVTNKFLAAQLVFLTVYIWHGIHAGYFLYAFTYGMITYAAREVRINVKKYFERSRVGMKLFHLMAVVVTQMFQSYLCIPFFCLHLRETLLVLRRIYFYVHVICAVVILLGCINRKLLQRKIKAN